MADAEPLLDRASIGHRAWWLDRLGAVTGRSELRRDGVATRTWAESTIAVPDGLGSALAGVTGGSLFLTHAATLTAVDACLARHTGRRTLVVAVPRDDGLGPVAVVQEIDLGRGFRDLLVEHRHGLLTSYEHQTYPLERLLRDLGSHADQATAPWGVAVALRPLHAAMPDVGQDVTLVFDASEVGHVQLTARHRVGALSARTVDSFAAHVLNVLVAGLADLDQPAVDLAMLTDDEVRVLLSGRPELTETPVHPVVANALDELVPTTNLTKNQLTVWAGQQLHPTAPLYNMVTLVAIDAEVDPTALSAAWQTMVAGTDALRTVVRARGGVPHAEIVDELALVPVEHIELVADSDADAQALRWAQQRWQRPLDVSQRPFDVALLTTGERSFWYLALHHLVTDDTSTHLVIERVADLYAATATAGRPVAASWPQFAAVVGADHAYRVSSRADSDRAFWDRWASRSLASVDWFGGVVNHRSSRTRDVELRFDAETVDALRAAGRRDGVSRAGDTDLLCGLVALWAATAHRLGAASEVGIGVALHNRPTSVLRATVGLCMEVCPLRLSIEDDDTLASLGAKADIELHTVLRHSRYTTGNPREHELYDIVVNLRTARTVTFAGRPAHTAWLHAGHGTDTVSFDALVEADGSLTAHIELLADVFSEQGAAAVVEELVRLAAGHGPITPANGRVPVPSASPASAAAPTSATLVDLVWERARLQPDHPAIDADECVITYGELVRKAEATAGALMDAGVRPGALVGLWAPTSARHLVGLLGVLRAGAACLPLDPALPAARRAAIVADARPDAMVIDSQSIQPVDHDGITFVLEDLDERNPTIPGPPPDRDALAFVWYTSGSTGGPKGVELTHGALAAFASHAAAHYGIDEHDRVLRFAALAFDASAEEIFCSLGSGATLVLRTDAAVGAPAAFLEAVRVAGVTVLDLPTSWFHHLAAHAGDGGKDRLADVRLVIVGGERMVPHRVREWRRRFGGSHRLCNTYGPTEAGVVATVHDVGPHDGAAKMIPIGRPLPGVEAYVLDEGLRPVPVGAPGELHLGGQQLARGYRFDPTTTATRFVPHPYGAPGARLLRTGDRCAWRPDGALEFLGRIDDQVKVRGHRVEPTEVDAALATYPGVWAAAVLAVEASDDSVRLVAHVAADPRPSADDLRRHLAARLPDALVPSTFVVRDELPMTTSGKIDRVALRALPAAVTEPRAYIAATTPEEQLVAAIWAEVFELAAVGLDDDFIELGGHSLLATQVVARIEEETGIALPIRAVFDAPTIDELAELLVRTAIESVDPDELVRLLDDLE